MQAGDIDGQLFDLNDHDEITNQKLILAATDQSLLASVHDLSEGGLIVGLLESAFAGQFSFNVVIDMTAEFLFAETPSRFIVSVAPQNREAFEALAGDSAKKIGEVLIHRPIKRQSAEQSRVNVRSLNEECGIFGVWGRSDAAQLTYYGLHALQHRGQEGAGIVSNREGHLWQERGLGLLSDVFRDPSRIDALQGNSAIGHVRYATAGSHDVQPGELLIIDDSGLTIDHYTDKTTLNIDAMEYIYFARPDSSIYGVNVHQARKRMGAALAAEQPVKDADIVVGVPNSSLSAAAGFAEATGLPNEMGLVKNQYIARTFIEPTQDKRDARGTYEIKCGS
ncbi:hypothetical protein Pfo_030998 [Paulownia fortunei]|nr:hypothetical protein Pfo_030998 [Paulownia fortunei]